MAIIDEYSDDEKNDNCIDSHSKDTPAAQFYPTTKFRISDHGSSYDRYGLLPILYFFEKG